MAKKDDKVDTILVYSIAGMLVLGAIGIMMGVGKKEPESALESPTEPAKAMSGCGCGMK